MSDTMAGRVLILVGLSLVLVLTSLIRSPEKVLGFQADAMARFLTGCSPTVWILNLTGLAAIVRESIRDQPTGSMIEAFLGRDPAVKRPSLL